MTHSTIDLLAVNLSKIEAIAQELPRIGSRRELKVKADEILRLTETVRRLAYALEADGEPGHYVPDFRQYGGGAAGKGRT